MGRKPQVQVDAENLIKQKQAELHAEIKARYPLLFMKFNQPQKDFLYIKNQNGKTPKRRIFEAGNKEGKCVTYHTLIDTPQGEVSMGELYEKGLPFPVYAWDGKKKVIAEASPPFRKEGLHQCYKITLSDGRWVEVADKHRILTSCGSYHNVSALASFFLQESPHILSSLKTYSKTPVLSTLGSCLSVLPSGVLHLSEKQLNFLDYYLADSHLYDEPLQKTTNTYQVFVPSQDDVLQRNVLLHKMDVQDSKYNNILLQFFSLLSNLGVPLRSLGQSFVSLFHSFCRLFRQYIGEGPIFPQLSFVGVYPPLSNNEFVQSFPSVFHEYDMGTSSFYKPPNKIESIYSIISIKPIGSQEVFDFEVEKYHNYFAGGLIHHNTYVGIAEDIAHVFGHRPWLKPEHPEYKIDVAVPNTGLIGCETIAHSVPEKIEPMLRLLIPDICKPKWKLGPTGALKKVTIEYDDLGKKCGSTIYVRSYDEHESTYEGIDYNWVHWDEPPPQKVLKAAERGKVVTNAPSWFTMTPLKEPYIYDQFSLNAFTHGGLDPEISVVRGSIWDNCRNYCWYCKFEIPENDEIRTIPRCPKCNRLMGFIPKAGIDEYLKTLDPDERETREFGIWHHLSGLVYKELSREYHIYNDFPIPRNWMRIEGVDPHDARPTCWLYGAVAPEEIEIYGKTRNRIYFYDYLLLDGNLDDMVRQIKAKRVLNGYAEPAFVVLDAKFGEKKEMEEKSWESELTRRGIHRIRLSHSNPGDVELGHKIVKEYLKLHYSSLLGLAKPGIMFAKEGCGRRGGPTHFMFNYQYKEGQSKPEEDYKDWPDTVRYVCMEQPIYREPEEFRNDIRKLNDRNQQTINQRRAVLRVGI